MLGNATVIILRYSAPTYDPYGDPDLDTPEEIAVAGAAVAPSNDELVDGRARAGTTGRMTLLAPAGTVFDRETDKVSVDGDVYEIDSDPAAWQNPFSGRRFGVQVELRKGEG